MVAFDGFSAKTITAASASPKTIWTNVAVRNIMVTFVGWTQILKNKKNFAKMDGICMKFEDEENIHGRKALIDSYHHNLGLFLECAAGSSHRPFLGPNGLMQSHRKGKVAVCENIRSFPFGGTNGNHRANSVRSVGREAF